MPTENLLRMTNIVKLFRLFTNCHIVRNSLQASENEAYQTLGEKLSAPGKERAGRRRLSQETSRNAMKRKVEGAT